MDPRSELEKRYPLTDFSVYFRHLVACRTANGPNTQGHHICPRAQFPEFVDHPENKVMLHFSDHDFAHKLLEFACGIKAPQTAYLESAAHGGRTPEHQRKAGRLGGLKGGSVWSKEKAEASRNNIIRATHNRWHVKRGTSSATCKFCCSGV